MLLQFCEHDNYTISTSSKWNIWFLKVSDLMEIPRITLSEHCRKRMQYSILLRLIQNKKVVHSLIPFHYCKYNFKTMFSRLDHKNPLQLPQLFYKEQDYCVSCAFIYTFITSLLQQELLMAFLKSCRMSTGMASSLNIH